MARRLFCCGSAVSPYANLPVDLQTPEHKSGGARLVYTVLVPCTSVGSLGPI